MTARIPSPSGPRAEPTAREGAGWRREPAARVAPVRPATPYHRTEEHQQ